MKLARRKLSGLTLVMMLATAHPAKGDTGALSDGAARQIAWNWDPLILFTLSLLAWLYIRGAIRIHNKWPARPLAGHLPFAAFAAALLALVAALLSPLDALAEQLVSAHMVQHLLLMMVAAPLAVLGRAGVVLNAGLPGSWRNDLWPLRRLLRVATRVERSAVAPIASWLIFAVVLWVWHLPALYHAALRRTVIHDLQHLTFFLAGVLFWRQVAHFASSKRRNAGMCLLFLFATSLHASLLGIFMALSPRPWYPAYGATIRLWSLTLLEDQQLAGLIMWVPACMIYPAVAAVLFGVWLHQLSHTGSSSVARPLSAKPRESTNAYRGTTEAKHAAARITGP